MQTFEQIKILLDALNKANDSYHNNADSLMSDAEYDKNKDLLIKSYEEILIPKKSKDPVFVKEVEDFLNQVGAEVTVSEWKKAKHKKQMTSLNKVNSEEELVKWANEINDNNYLIMDKVDGGSIDIVYENSKIVQAITRGDGNMGDDITQNVIKMKNIKSTIPGFTGMLKGEIIILREDFETLSLQADCKNARNSAVGTSKRLDGKFSDLLSVFHYDIYDENVEFQTEEEKLLALEKYNLKTCFWKKVTLKNAIEVFNEYENSIRANLNYDIDGMVIRCNSIAKQEEHGMLGSNPKAKIAWKFKPLKKETKILDVEWHIGNSRTITPIALLQPIHMGGVTVSRCSLYNVSFFQEMQFSKNGNVLLVRCNDVIPAILENLDKGHGDLFIIPTKCPECGGMAAIEGKFLKCTNDNCSGLGTGNLKRWIETLEVDSIGPKLIDNLYHSNLVREPADFYKLSKVQLIRLERMGERSATKILKNLKAKTELTMSEFIAGLNMPNFSGQTAKSLEEAGFDSINKIFDAQEHELIKVKGIEIKTARQIIKGMQSKANTIKNLFDVGITIKQEKKFEPTSNILKGLSFCFTGAIQAIRTDGKRFTRDDMHKLVIEDNGVVTESVKKGLSYLVMADPSSTSTKANKARELGISVLSEEDFFKMIG